MTQKEMLQQLLNVTTEIKSDVADLRTRVETLEKGKAPKSGRGSSKEEKPAKTKKEAIAEWASKKYSEAERKAYGEKKRQERANQAKAKELANAKFKERVEYSVWRAEYEKQLKKLSK